MPDVVLHGPKYSPYTRVVRLVLAEKKIDYQLVEIDFLNSGFPDRFDRLHPFIKLPVLEHDSFVVYETNAIVRYLDRAFPEPPLFPKNARSAARVDQVISVVDAYAYEPMIHQVFVPRVMAPLRDQVPDERRIEQGQTRSKVVLLALEQLKHPATTWFVSNSVSAADLYLIPMLLYYVQAREGALALRDHPRLAGWWAKARSLESIEITKGPMG